jgi:hypothetical protein
MSKASSIMSLGKRLSVNTRASGSVALNKLGLWEATKFSDISKPDIVTIKNSDMAGNQCSFVATMRGMRVVQSAEGFQLCKNVTLL